VVNFWRENGLQMGFGVQVFGILEAFGLWLVS
jgi:hypothetical protein